MSTLARATPAAYPQGSAACVGVDPDAFFPPGRNERLEREAIEHCQACPLQAACLDYALAWDVRGIWGGTTYRQREQIRSTRGIAALPVVVGWITDRSQSGAAPFASLAASPPAGDIPDLDSAPEGDPMPETPPTPLNVARGNARPEHAPERCDVESVDGLLAEARELGDRKVSAAVERAENAIAKLRDVYTEAADRIAAEQAAQEARAEALAEIERLKAQLAAAEARAAEAGVKLRKTPAKTRSKQERSDAAKVREWAKSRSIAVPERGRIPGSVLEQYEAAHQAVAS